MRPPLVLLLAGAVLLASCGDDEPAGDGKEPGACHEARAGTVTLVAEDLAWDVSCLSAPPGPLLVVVDNRDDGVNHNVHLTDAPEEPKTALEAGPVRQELSLDLAAGDYEFVCDIHPNMVGTLTIGGANSADP